MFRSRVIPCLLLMGDGLVKTRRFRAPKYVGDPINAVRIFNDLEVDELVFLDILASPEGRGPDFRRVESIASECFMPVCYGGGVRSVKDARTLFGIGIEKISVTSALGDCPGLLADLAEEFGSQSVIAGVDIKSNWLGKQCAYTYRGKQLVSKCPTEYVRYLEGSGAGELLLNFIDRDGMQLGYDLACIEKLSASVGIPVIACGGAGKLEDLEHAVRAGASAAAAGSLFVYSGPHNAILINYPTKKELDGLSRCSQGEGKQL